MLNTQQRSIVFFLFCAFTVVCVGLEVYLVVSLLGEEPNLWKGVGGFLNTTLLLGIGRSFKKMIDRAFLKSSVVPIDRLHRFASERCRIADNVKSANHDVYTTRLELIRNTLKLAEESLRGWVPGSHFELCVFVDKDQPLLFAYFDTNHDTTARSMAERNSEPNFYVAQGYEVTKLLQNPTSQPRILENTQGAAIDYIFTSSEQEKQLKSTALFCLDVSTPCALVATSNEKKAFVETDPEVISFLKYIGSLVRYDLFDANFIHEIRSIKPELFNNVPYIAIAEAAIVSAPLKTEPRR